MVTDTLLKKFPIISDQVDKKELRVILREFETWLSQNNMGDVVEFGCYVGTTSLFIRRLLDEYHSGAVFHAYDSFEGLPEKVAADKSVAGDQFVAGALHASRKTFWENFHKAHLQQPIVHKSWFDQLAEDDVPSQIGFAFFDGDYYESIDDSFRLTHDKFMPHATIIVDDYANEALPGAQKATDKWTKILGASIRSEASLGIIHL